MDIFISSLTINNTTTQSEAFESCLRIICWLQNTSLSTLYRSDLQFMLKATLYVTESLKLFGNDLKSVLRQECNSKGLMSKDALEALLNTNGIVFACQQILKSNCGIAHACFIEKLLKKLCKDEELRVTQEEVESNMLTGYDNEVKDKRWQMIVVLQRLFELNCSQIDNVIERVVQHIEFNVLGYIFLEPESSPYHLKCAILEHKICSLIAKRRINFSFFRSIFLLASTSNDGLQFFLSTLKNATLLNCLVEYFTYYLRCAFENNEDSNIFPASHQNLYLTNIIFLINCILNNIKINSNDLLDLSNYLNTLCSVYDF